MFAGFDAADRSIRLGRLQSETNPESGTITYAYKPNDLVETVSDQRGIVRTYSYNTRNLATNVSYNDGGATPSVTFGYDEFGSRTSMADGEGTSTYVYNGFRQLESESRGLPNGRTSKLTYTYNLSDQAKQVNYAIYNGATATFSKNVNYARNNTGAISGIGTNLIGTDPNANANVASGVGYRAWNVYRGMNFGNGLRLTAGYNSQRQQMTSFVVDTQSGSSVLWRQHYDYYESGKNNGRIRRLSDQPDFSTYNKYHYDTYNRLTLVQMHPSLAWHAAYSHDEWGNIRTINSVASGGATLTYQTNATGAPTNRLSTAGAYSFSYDAAGNMTAGNGTTFGYDAANRLKGVGGVSNQYGYDGDGNRVRQPGLYSVWSSVLDKVAFEVDASANVQRAFVYLGSEVIALQSTDGGFYWTHTDHLSSGRMLTNTAGSVVYRGDFDPFGQAYYEWSASGNVNLNTRKFTGYERDATGLDYARARTYTSSWGRFVQADPLGSGFRGQRPNPLGAAKNDKPQTLNRYGYVSNDPVNLTDPSGLLLRNPDDGCICCGGVTGGGGVQTSCTESCSSCCKGATIGCLIAVGTCEGLALESYNNAKTQCLNNNFCDRDNSAYDPERCDRCLATARDNFIIRSGICAGAYLGCLALKNFVCRDARTCTPPPPAAPLPCKCDFFP